MHGCGLRIPQFFPFANPSAKSAIFAIFGSRAIFANDANDAGPLGRLSGPPSRHSDSQGTVRKNRNIREIRSRGHFRELYGFRGHIPERFGSDSRSRPQGDSDASPSPEPWPPPYFCEFCEFCEWVRRSRTWGSLTVCSPGAVGRRFHDGTRSPPLGQPSKQAGPRSRLRAVRADHDLVPPPDSDAKPIAIFAQFAESRSRPARAPRHARERLPASRPPPFLRILRILRIGPQAGSRRP